MRAAASRLTGSHRALAVTVVTGLLVLSGVSCIGVAATRQQHSSQPPLSRVDSPRQQAPPPTSEGQQSPATPMVVGPVMAASAPVTLAISAIGVSSRVQRLGRTAGGALAVPAPGPHYDEVGWYRYSPMPGSVGPSVIVGHVDSAANGPSVFARLGSLRARDRVRITRADGSVAVFAVDDVRRFRKARFPSQLVYGNTNRAALRLITCGGPLESGHYRDNVIVRASLIRETA